MAGKKQFTLPDKKVLVKFIRKQRGSITDSKHVAFGGLLENAAKVLPVRQLRNGSYANVLTDEEKEGLEQIMGLEKNTLSIYNKSYWDKIKVELYKEGNYFYLNDPIDYIKVKILRTYDDMIAGSLKEYNEKAKKTYLFIIIEEGEEAAGQVKEVDIKQQAWMQYGKISEDHSALVDYLMIIGMPVDKNSDKNWIKSQVAKSLEENPRKFLSILNDPDYKIKTLIKKAVGNNLLKYSSGLYHTLEGIPLASKTHKATLANAIAYLKSDEGQDIRMFLEGNLEK